MSLELYNKLRVVPDEAKKTIQGGKLKGFTDVNPMWRIKILTETFGVCGFGWKYRTVEHWTHTSGATGETAVFVRIELFVKMNGEWSDAIEGVGGSKLDSKNKNGMETTDECFKMATTDALSVACKQLGIAADVYFSKDCTKYTHGSAEEVKASRVKPADIIVIKDEIAKRQCTMNQVLQHFKLTKIEEMTFDQFQVAMKMLDNTPLKGAEHGNE